MSLIDKLANKISETKDSLNETIAANIASENEAEDADVDFFLGLSDPVVAHVTCDVLNVRSTPSTDQARIGTLKRGAAISVLAICDEWLKIEFEGKDAYVFSIYTDYEAPEMTVTASSLNIRKAPGTDSDKIGSLPNGAVVRVLAEKDGWVKILNGRHIGYVSKQYLK